MQPIAEGMALSKMRELQTGMSAYKKGSHGLYTQHKNFITEKIDTICLPCMCNFNTIEVFNPPQPFFQSKRRPGLEVNGQKARDMKYGDLSDADIKRIFPHWWQEFQMDLDESSLWFNLKAMANAFFAGGKGRGYVNALIDHLKGNTGAVFRHDGLTQDAIKHPKVREFVTKLDDHVEREIKKNTDFNRIFNIPGNKRGWRKPVFNHFWNDTLWGNLTFAVNDIWGYKIDVIAYEERDTNYCLELEITLYDHFGLDETDVTGIESKMGSIYGLLAGFRAWFLLQRWNKYAYKPFVTEMKWRRTYQGVF